MTELSLVCLALYTATSLFVGTLLIFMPPARYLRWVARDRASRALATA